MRMVPAQALDLTSRFEGLRLTAYPDPASGGVPWTIGYGSTKGVVKGMTITLAEARARLETDLEAAAARVEGVVQPGPLAALSDNQYCALLSFVFNVGVNPKWTIWKLINARQFDKVPDQLRLFVNAAGKRMPDLVKRRAAESAMWASSIPAKPPVPVIGVGPLVVASAPVAAIVAHASPSLAPWFIAIALVLCFVAAVYLFHLSTRKPPMPSQQFADALTNLLAAKDAQAAKMVEAATAPLNAKIAELEAVPQVTDTGPAVDADDTAALVSATPAV